MDNAVTVEYATADGTAQAGEDYAATSGTLTFAPHERLKTVDVPINADVVARDQRDVLPEPVEREQRDDGRRPGGGDDLSRTGRGRAAAAGSSTPFPAAGPPPPRRSSPQPPPTTPRPLAASSPAYRA